MDARRPLRVSRIGLGVELLVFTRTAIIATFGHQLLQHSNRFAATPPGLAGSPLNVAARPIEAGDKPDLTGSSLELKTIGIVVVTALAASAEAAAGCNDHNHLSADQIGRKLWQLVVLVPPPSGIRSRHSGPRRSQLRLGPAKGGDKICSLIGRSAAEEPDNRHRRCCARAASGHMAAAPPSSVMNSRLLIQSPRRRGRAASAARRARALWRS